MENFSVFLSWEELPCLHILLHVCLGMQHYFNLDLLFSYTYTGSSPPIYIFCRKKKKLSWSVNVREKERMVPSGPNISDYPPAYSGSFYFDSKPKKIGTSLGLLLRLILLCCFGPMDHYSPFSSSFSFQSSKISLKPSSTVWILSQLPALF